MKLNVRRGRALPTLLALLVAACGKSGSEQLAHASASASESALASAVPPLSASAAPPGAAVRCAGAVFTLPLEDKRRKVGGGGGQVGVAGPAAPAAAGPSKGLKTPLRAKDKLPVPRGKPLAAGLMAQCKQAAETAE